jgi:hypothetical protein
MEHEFRLPARVVEVTRDGRSEEDPDTAETLPPPPAATDDGTPINSTPQPAPDAR